MNRKVRSRLSFGFLILFHFVLIMATTSDALGDFATTSEALWVVLLGWGVFFFLISRKDKHE